MAGRKETYRTTERHPFWTETGGDEGRGGFVAAGDLKVGQQLRLADGSAAYVTCVTATGVVEPVYNFSVEGWRTYHVGELGVWVHNECPAAALRRLAAQGHAQCRHGEGVTDEQLRYRARTGIAPDGSRVTIRGGPRNGQAAIPALSSAFDSDRDIVDADALLRQRLQALIEANPGRREFDVQVDMGRVVGRGYEGGTLARVDGLTHVTGTYVRNILTGAWEARTIYPSLPLP